MAGATARAGLEDNGPGNDEDFDFSQLMQGSEMVLASVMARALKEVRKEKDEGDEALQQELVQMVGIGVDEHRRLRGRRAVHM